MSPSSEVVRCPFCLGRRRVRKDGKMHLHDWGRPGMMKRCPGAERTLEEAKAAKSAGPPYEVPSGPPDSLADAAREVRPEDLF